MGVSPTKVGVFRRVMCEFKRLQKVLPSLKGSRRTSSAQLLQLLAGVRPVGRAVLQQAGRLAYDSAPP